MLRFILPHFYHSLYKYHFNTSHVTVYRVVSGAIPGYKDISIHLMLRFITHGKKEIHGPKLISIHLMLRFILSQKKKKEKEVISIHLMLRFISTNGSSKLSRCGISIHLMLRFILQISSNYLYQYLFQYISCYGLSLGRI